MDPQLQVLKSMDLFAEDDLELEEVREVHAAWGT